MATQFWRPIQPVEGQPIPEGAEYLADEDAWDVPDFDNWPNFIAPDLEVPWRVPVEVVPMDVAANLVARLFRYGFRGVFNVNPQELANMEEFPELVVAKLRELSQENANATD